jgi:hypothetical protein
MYGSGLNSRSFESLKNKEQSKALGIAYQLLIQIHEDTKIDENNNVIV